MFERIKSLFKKPESVPQTGKFSNEPWVEVISSGCDAEKGMKLELDWNDAFVQYLKDNGYAGATEEAIVGKWLVQMYAQMSSRLKDDKHEFE